MVVRKVADVTKEEIEECESKELFDSYSQEFLYVKMTSRKQPPNSGPKKRSRWPTLDQLRPKLKRASLMETSLEEEQVVPPSVRILKAGEESGLFSCMGHQILTNFFGFECFFATQNDFTTFSVDLTLRLRLRDCCSFHSLVFDRNSGYQSYTIFMKLWCWIHSL